MNALSMILWHRSRLLRIIFLLGCALGLLFSQDAFAQKKKKKKKSSSKKTAVANTKAKSATFPLNLTEYYFENVRILQMPSNSDLVLAKIYITGGIQHYSLEEEGIELLCLKAVIQGSTKTRNKQLLDELLEKYAAKIEVYSGYDYSVVSLLCLKQYFSEVLDIVMERLTSPAFSASEFYEIRDAYMVELTQKENDPWDKLRKLSLSKYFKDTPYQVNPLGSYQALFNFSHEGANYFYSQLLAQKRIFITFVGDMPAQEVAILFHQYLKNLPVEITTTQKSLRFYPPMQPTGTLEPLDNTSLNYVNAVFNAPKPGSLDAFALEIALAVLNERLQQKLQWQKGFLNEVYCGYAEFSIPFASIRFSTKVPSPAIKAVIEELTKMKTEGISTEELEIKKQFFLSQYHQKLFRVETRAETIGKAAFHYSWKEELKSVQKVQSITNAQVLAVLQKYMKNIQWYFLGDVSKIGKGIFEKPF